MAERGVSRLFPSRVRDVNDTVGSGYADRQRPDEQRRLVPSAALHLGDIETCVLQGFEGRPVPVAVAAGPGRVFRR